MSPVDREARLRAALERELRALDGETLTAVARALERDRDRLEAGAWGTSEDGEGCLLSLAAWELGLDSGEQLMLRSVAAVRVPAIFDELWALVLARTGDPAHARGLVHRLVVEALDRLAEDRGERPPPHAAATGVGSAG